MSSKKKSSFKSSLEKQKELLSHLLLIPFATCGETACVLGPTIPICKTVVTVPALYRGSSCIQVKHSEFQARHKQVLSVGCSSRYEPTP